MHLKLEILFHSVVWRTYATCNPWYNPWFNFLFFQDYHIILFNYCWKTWRCVLPCGLPKGLKGLLCISARKRFSICCLCRNVILFFLNKNLFERCYQRYRSGYINNQLSVTLFCSFSCTWKCLLWILVWPLLGMRLGSDLAQECGTSHWGTAESEHWTVKAVLLILLMSLMPSQSSSGTHVQPATGCRFQNADSLQHPQIPCSSRNSR